MLEGSLKTIRNGEVVEGTVIDVKEDEAILNIGYKSDGILTKNEYSNSPIDLTTVIHVGDTMEVKVLKVNDGEGQVLLTYKRLAAEKGSKRLKEAFENEEVLTAPVTQVLDGGLSVVVDESRVFIPASLVSDTYEKNLAKYEGQENLSLAVIYLQNLNFHCIAYMDHCGQVYRAVAVLALGQDTVGFVANVQNGFIFFDINHSAFDNLSVSYCFQ